MNNNIDPASIDPADVDRRIYDLYDEYCHSSMTRREFLQKASAITVAGVSGLAMAQSLLPRYAQAQTISFTDERIKANYVEYPSPGGTSGEMRAYLVRSVGFCWGGGTTNYLAVTMGADLHAAVPFYGSSPSAEEVKAIEAPLMVQLAEDDERINAQIPDFEAALTEQGNDFAVHMYPGTRHGFHNNSTPRFNKEAAELAETRTMDFLKQHLS